MSTAINTTENYRQLGFEVALRAGVDYFQTSSEKQKAKILADLKSSWMDFITDGLALILAEKVETTPKEVENGLRMYGHENN